MSIPSTPLKDDESVLKRDLAHQTTSGVFYNKRSVLKSPQVVFPNDPKLDRPTKHARSTPQSGRGKLKKLREQVRSKVSAQRIARASPSHIVSKSMLTFDLHGGRIGNDEIPGESELFVNFVKDRRASNGRGSLKELINKRIALQVGAQALAVREAEKNVANTKQLQKPVTTENSSMQSAGGKSSIPKKKSERVNKPVHVSRRGSEFLEVPLAQEELEEPMMSQTQVFERSQPLTQTQIYRPEEPENEGEESQLPFLSTPLVMDWGRPRSDCDHLEPVTEEDEEEPVQPKRAAGRNRFVDDEAEESGEGSEDLTDDGEDTDLSDLIASSPEESQSQGGHARLHAKWLEEQENSFDPFAIKNRSDGESMKAKRRLRRALFPINELPIPIKTKKPAKTAGKPAKKEEEVVPPVPKPREPVRVKRYPHRKSSVSSACSELDIHVGGQTLNNRPRPSSGTFSFIQAPPKDKLEKATSSLLSREEATAKAMAGATKLMGNKRFAFGQTVVE
jgi:hypothetical protein